MSDVARQPVVAALKSADGTGRGIRVEFVRLSDRYAHRILAIGCEELPVLLLESVEAIAKDDYSSSPVLQALNVDDLATEEEERHVAAMLVGMSNKGHWSLSVQADESAASITFDAACRIKRIPESLGSCYLWGERVHVEDVDHFPRLHFGSGICTIELWDGESYGLPWVCDRYLRTVTFSAPGDPLRTPLPATLRWRYRMTVGDTHTTRGKRRR